MAYANSDISADLAAATPLPGLIQPVMRKFLLHHYQGFHSSIFRSKTGF